MYSDPRLQTSIARVESSLLDLEQYSEHFKKRKEDHGLTIFVPNWNHRHFLPRCLRSAIDALDHLKAEGFSGEILVVDDASRDGSQKLLRSVQALYNEPRLRTICLDQNLGLTRLRNLALLSAKNKYLCMLDADNEIVAENISLFVRSIIATNATMVYGNLLFKEGREVKTTVSDIKPTWMLVDRPYVDAFAVVDAERILNIGGYARLHPYLADDWEMTMHLIAEEEPFVFVPAILGYYHKLALSAGTENLTRRPSSWPVAHRTYAQSGPRGWDSERVGRMYHPELGFIG